MRNSVSYGSVKGLLTAPWRGQKCYSVPREYLFMQSRESHVDSFARLGRVPHRTEIVSASLRREYNKDGLEVRTPAAYHFSSLPAVRSKSQKSIPS
jgi:hypothetical protein